MLLFINIKLIFYFPFWKFYAQFLTALSMNSSFLSVFWKAKATYNLSISKVHIKCFNNSSYFEQTNSSKQSKTTIKDYF